MRCTTPARRFPGWFPLFALALAGCQPAAGFPDVAPDEPAQVDAAAEAAGADAAIPVGDVSDPQAPPTADAAAPPTATPASDTTSPPQQNAAPEAAAGAVSAAGSGGGDSAGVAATPPPATPPPATPPPPRPTPPDAASSSCRIAEPAERPGTRRLSVFFTCGEEERAVVRVVSGSPAVLRAALEALLRGPTGDERAAGYRSFFSDATGGMLRGIAVRDGVARVDFRDFSSIIPNASSSAGSAQLIAQLRETIFQFPTVQSAEILFDGSCERFWNWLQRGCQRLTR
jgi:hypothetical protein